MYVVRPAWGPVVEIERTELGFLLSFESAYESRLERDARAREVVIRSAELAIDALVVEEPSLVTEIHIDIWQRGYILVAAPASTSVEEIVDTLINSAEEYNVDAHMIRLAQARTALGWALQKHPAVEDLDFDEAEFAFASLVEQLDHLTIAPLWDEIPANLKPRVVEMLEQAAQSGVILEHQPWDAARVKKNAEIVHAIVQRRGWAA